MRTLITGASGYLAHRLIPAVSQRTSVSGIARDATAVPKPATAYSVDLSNQQQVMESVSFIRPHVIIHTAAANPGHDEAEMDNGNHLAARHIAIAANAIGARLIAVSTDIVHDGTGAPYADDAPASPVNRYGQTKAQGEVAISNHCPTAAIVRTSLIYDLNQIDRGTAGFIERLQRGEKLSLFTDVIRQPVWIESLVQALCRLAFDATDVRGTLNVVGDQPMSRAQFGLTMLGYWNADIKSGQVVEATGKQIDGLPLDLRMHCQQARALGIDLPGVDAVLAAAARNSFDL